MSAPVFLKLGGALLTDKDRRETLRPELLARLAAELAAWPGSREGRLVLAHGSGSFAHMAARETGFLESPAEPMAFARVAAAARRLNGLVIDACLAAGLPALGLPGGLLADCADGRIVALRHELVTRRLAMGLVPTLYGDAAPDRERGGAIASTEPLLAALAEALAPERIVLATDVDGVFHADPHAQPDAEPWPELRPGDRAALAESLGRARPGAVDVTGGMAAKVLAMLDLVARRPALEVRIVSGLRPGAVMAALEGRPEAGGTRIRA